MRVRFWGIGFVVFVFGLGFGYSLEDKEWPAAGAADRSVGGRTLRADGLR